MTDLADVRAVVVNWNGGDENLACLGSLLDQGLPEEAILFVDNGSTDGSLEPVRARFPRAQRIENADNLGFAEASNQGACRALEQGARAVLFLNNDATLGPATLRTLLEELGQEGVGIVGPRILYKGEPERVWAAGGLLTWRQNVSTLLGHRRRDGARWQRSRDVDYVAGCALLARREVLDQVGLFDASYFAYMEDVDLCLRARARGWRVRLVGGVLAYHTGAVATGGGYNPRRKYMMGVNSIWFLRRHAGPVQWLSFLVWDVASLPFVWLLGLARGTSHATLAKARGILDGLRGKRVSAEAVRQEPR